MAGLKRTILFSCAVALAAGTSALIAEDNDDALLARAQQQFKPLPKDASTPDRPLTPERVALGRSLFFETRVSSDGKGSCGGCHNAFMYGADGLPRSVGVGGKVIPRNAPTVFNTALQFVQHYGGNRADVEEQAVKALVSPLAYGNADYAAAEARMRALPYREMFDKAFPGEPEPVTAKNWGLAIGAYERTLITPAPFDDYLKGNKSALSTQAKQGLEKFMAYGCSGCHSGVTVGGQMFQKFGLTQNYWELTGSQEIDLFKGRDKGKFQDTKNDADAFMFKVQQLRNVAMTPPYFHDGSVAELGDAIRIMGKLQLGRDLSDRDIADIKSFLQSLTGEVPAQFITVPTLPAAAYRN